MQKFETYTKVLKVNDETGLVLGWGIICTVDDVPYFDLQKDHIPEDSMFKAAADFMMNSRKAKEMHSGSSVGNVIFAWPMTKETNEVFGIECNKTGLLVAMKPNPEVLEKFRSGELTGFSIGGRRGKDKVVEQ